MTKGFWLPIELLHNKNITMQEKLILIEISQLTMLDKGCIASNNHFAETFKVKKESISRSLSSLEQKGYITTKIKDGSRNHERTITINKMLFKYEQNVTEPLTKCLETKENKTDNKTIEVNPLTFGEFTKYDFQLKKQVSFDKLTKEYLSKLEIEIDDHNEKLMLKRLNVNSPLTETLSFREFSIKFLSNGRKQTNFWTKFLEYEQYTFENEAKKKGIR